MCVACWPDFARKEYLRTCEEYSDDVYDAFGTPDDEWSELHLKYVPADVWRAVSAVRQVYRDNMVGGNLHAIIDDWNIEDECFTGVGDLFTRNEEDAYLLLKELSVFDRARVLYLADRM